MRFRILGPLEVWDGERQTSVGGPQQRALLAVLLLNANQVVSADRLMGELWGGEPPAAARRLLQGCVVRLRRVLGEHQPLVTRAPGYLLEVRPGELDLDRFDELVDAAKHGSPEEAAALLTEALALWRGPALDGVGTDTCQTQARRLDERRQVVLEDRVDADLRRGRHAELVGELRAHVRAHPLRERLWAQLMLALYGAGRQADALAAYRELRTTLVDQLGVEPNATVRNVECAILAGGDALAAYRSEDSTKRLVPAQLPPVAAAFTGRSHHLAELDHGSAITVIDGMPGVGKTALAVRWAHLVRDRFPDGQLYLNLRGFAPTPPVTPIEALTEFLHALGLPARLVPAEVDRAAAQFRSLLADRRLLILLDNACSAEQIRPLLPAGSGCQVLVTSRDRLTGLVARDGARRITLDVLTSDEVMALLREVVGVERVQAEPEAAAELGRACASLPLALRIAAAAITDAPHRTIAGYVAGLTLSSLAVDGDEQTGVRATFDLSYAALTEEAQRMFCLLGLVPGPDVTVEAAAAIGDTSPAEAERLLHRLTAAHLVEEHTPGRYAFHDLLRAYALERAGTDEQALRRLHDWYLHRAHAATRLVYPEKLRLPLPDCTATFDDDVAALRWLDAERAGLVAAVRQGPAESAWRLADALRGYFWGHGHWVDWLTTAEAGLAAAESEGDPHALAASCISLADAHRCRNRYPRSVQLYTRAAELSREAGWLECEGVALGNLGVTYWEMGCLLQAVNQLTRALVIARRHGWRPSQAANLSNLGLSFRQLGQLNRAADLFAEALALDRELGMRGSEGVDLAHLGLVECLRGRLDTAMELTASALALQRELGNKYLEGATLRQFALVHLEAGRHTDALRAARTALTLARESGNRLVEALALATTGTAHHHLGQHPEAVDHLQRAVRLGRHIGAPDPQIEAMIGLAATDETYADQAVALASRYGYRLLEGQALTARANLHLARDRVGRAVADAEVALAIHRETGHRPGETRALLVLSRATALLTRN